MAAPTYSNDLTTVDEAEATTNWAESSDGNWDDGGSPSSDADYPYIQTGAGNGAISQQMTKTGICSLFVDNGSGITLPTDGAYLIWQVYSSNLGIQTYANGGLRMMVGSGLGDFYSWDVGGSDFGKYPYGGWQNHAVNPNVTPDDTVGTPTATEQYIGAAVNTTTGISKGNPHAVDVVRYGRCSSIFEDGDSGAGGPATFAGFAAANDASTARWGLLQATDYGYLWKGKMTLGTAGTPVYFRDSDTLILVDATPKVTANFNTIEVNDASSDIGWTNITISALGTASPGRLVMNANATLAWDACTFNNMGAFTFGGTNSAATNCAFKGCGVITPAGADMTGSSVEGYEGTADSSALVWNVATDPDGYLDDMSFTKGTAATHAIEFGTSSPLSMTLRGISFAGYNASNGQNDSALYIARTTGTVNITIVDGTAPSYKSAGATVNIITNTVTVRVTAKDIETLLPVQGARVVLSADSGGDLPSGASVSITRSGTTATVSHTGHGFSTGDYVWISGAAEQQYNGIFQITVTGVDAYTYTVDDSPGTPATGSPTATAVILYGLTDANGVVQDTSFAYTSDQPVTGRIRKGTNAPLYKTSPLAESILSTGYSVTSFLVPDE
jgi:hypothetical protein